MKVTTQHGSEWLVLLFSTAKTKPKNASQHGAVRRNVAQQENRPPTVDNSLGVWHVLRMDFHCKYRQSVVYQLQNRAAHTSCSRVQTQGSADRRFALIVFIAIE